MTQTTQTPQAFEKDLAPHIPLTDVESSQVKSIGYDPATQTLAVQFKHGSGAIYHYPDVTADQHQAFLKAESIGAHFGRHIKPLAFRKFRGVRS